jgi:glucosylceramidase
MNPATLVLTLISTSLIFIPAHSKNKTQNETLYYTILQNNQFINTDNQQLVQQMLNSTGTFDQPPIITEGTLLINLNARKHRVVGFGGSVTESCIGNIDKMPAAKKEATLNSLFSQKTGARFNFLRLSFGANDFSSSDYTFDDMPKGETDPEFKKLNFTPFETQIQFVKTARKLNPAIQLMASAWSPPGWMKDTDKIKGGQINTRHFSSYAEYLIKTIKYLSKNKLKLKYLTILNEPLIGFAKENWGFAQTYMTVDDQYNFTTDSMIPALAKNSIKTQILIHDHNWDNSEGTIDKFYQKLEQQNPHLGGVAYHCYGGDGNTQLRVLEKYRGTQFINTECSGVLRDNDSRQTFHWWLRNQSLDAVQAGTSGALAWNLCLDESGGPRNNGCRGCRGLLTINSKSHDVTYNPEYYALKQVSRFVHENAQVVENSFTGETELRALTAINTNGSLAIIIRNPTQQFVNLKIEGFQNSFLIPPNSALSIIK